VTYVPVENFRDAYGRIIDNVKATGPKALLMGLPRDIRQFPTLRTGPQIASQRPALAAYDVTGRAGCDASPSFVFVRGKVLLAVATGAARAAAGAGLVDLSCADVPGTGLHPDAGGHRLRERPAVPHERRHHGTCGGEPVRDLVPGRAVRDLQDGGGLRPPGVPDVARPLRDSISLDGIHPAPAGQGMLARAALTAVNLAYGSSLAAPL
jgi:hypothetical protein